MPAPGDDARPLRAAHASLPRLAAVRNAKALRLLSWAAAATIAAGRVARLGSVARAVASPAAIGLAALGYAAHAFVGEFSFKYVSTKRDRDLRKIPKVYADERLDD